MKTSYILFIILLHSVFSSISAQTPGSLDNTFDGDGKLSIPMGAANAFGQAITLQEDGKILISVNVSNGNNNDFGLIRLLTDGSLDSVFGNNGKVITDLNGDADYTTSIAYDSISHRIFVGGYTEVGSGFDFAIACFLTGGNLDSSFGTNGKVITHLGDAAFAKGMIVQPDGKIILGGYTFLNGFNRFAAVRYTTTGILDPGFNGNGIAILPFGNSSALANSILIQPDDEKIVLAGQVFNLNTNRWDFALARLNSDGTPDSLFDGDGELNTIFGLTNNTIYSVAIQDDGKIIAAGSSGTSSTDNQFTLARYFPDGTLDSSFGTNGIVIRGIGVGNNAAQSVLVQPDGKIIAGGYLHIGSSDNIALARFLTNGAPDNNFGNAGTVTTIIGQNDGINAMAFQADGKVIVTGTSFTGNNFELAVLRFETGLLDNVSDFQKNKLSFSAYPNPATTEVTLDYTLLKPDFINVKLIDITGRTILHKTSTFREPIGNHKIFLTLSSELKSGIYTVEIFSEQDCSSLKIILAE